MAPIEDMTTSDIIRAMANIEAANDKLRGGSGATWMRLQQELQKRDLVAQTQFLNTKG